KCMKFNLLVLLSVFLSSCAGYQLGGAKPPSLASVQRISVSMLENGTLHPRAEAIATSAVTAAVVQNGTYHLSDLDHADAVLEGEVTSIDYSALRGSRLDALAAEELTNTVKISWRLKDARDPTKLLASGSSMGQSTFFVDSNLQTARQNALPDAFERAAQNLILRISSGY
ncbi:MAG: LPS assembly lipoprotein LptE, partial [Akkermansiaceae bacterium]